MKILILGHGRHGKDTLAALLAERTGLTYGSSTLVALEAIWPALKMYPDVGNSLTEAYDKRAEHRELWRRLISLYNAHDKTALARKVLEQYDMYVGMRCAEEYKACMDAKLFDMVVWVDRPGWAPDPSMSIPLDMFTMHHVNNNGDIAHLRYLAHVLTQDVIDPLRFSRAQQPPSVPPPPPAPNGFIRGFVQAVPASRQFPAYEVEFPSGVKSVKAANSPMHAVELAMLDLPREQANFVAAVTSTLTGARFRVSVEV